MSYKAPLSDTAFQLQHIIPFHALAADYPDVDSDVVNAICESVAKISEDVYAPLRKEMDENPVYLDGDNVVMPANVGTALNVLADSGLIGVCAAEQYGGIAMPLIVQMATNEYLCAANMSLQLCSLLTQGQIEALETHASDDLAAQIIPKLVSGEWTGTMLLTEPQAGSDLGALSTKAVPLEDGSYSLSGQKIFITWGEHNHAENISHLTLARLPNAPKGAKGISLFYVPKFLADNNRNGIHCIGLEEKLGIHGSPTCVMELKDAKGYLIGEENKGLACMFTMMNNARLNVGVQGYALAEAAYQQAAEFAKSRVQGRTKGPTGAIIDHGDVRRMLLSMRSKIHIARSLCYDCAIALDLGKNDEAMAARGAILTPLAKSYSSDIGVEVASEAIQVFGGMGYIEETGIAQYLRDVRITPIYEGTNGVQAMDLVGRKMMDDGTAIKALIDNLHIDDTVREDFINATNALLSRDLSERGGDACDYQRAFAEVLGVHYLSKGAPHSKLYNAMLEDHLARVIPVTRAKLNAITATARDVFAIDADDF